MKTNKRKKFNVPMFILSLMVLIVLVFFVVFLNVLDVLPLKYYLLVTLTLVSIYLFGMLMLAKKKFVSRLISYTVFVTLFAICTVGAYYSGVTISYLDETFNTVASSTEIKYVVISKDVNSMSDLNDKTLGYYSKIPYIDKANIKLSKALNYDTKEYTNVLELFENINDEKIDGAIFEETIYSSLKDSLNVIDFTKYKTLEEFTITVEDITSASNNGDVINIYLMGVDFSETINDFNMVLTINKKTRKILMTSVPRDYYVYSPALGASDNLSLTNHWGLNAPLSAMENLFDIKMDYYLTFNTYSVVDLVDALGGIEFCSDKEFTTSHVQAMTYYADKFDGDEKLTVPATCKVYNGIEILTISRERLAFIDGDIQRQKNCQQILSNIIDKLISFDSFKNYTTILDKLKDMYTTNIPDSLVTGMIKMTIADRKWTMEKQSVNGEGAWGEIVLGTKTGFIMKPDQKLVDAAKKKIKSVSE